MMTPAEILRLFFCEECADKHGENPQSVSCYCACHSSARDEARWPTVRGDVLAILRINKCPRCNGTGKVEVASFRDPEKTVAKSCHVCKGSGVLK